MSYKRFLLALMLVSSFVLTSCGSIPYQTSRTPQIKKSTSVKTSNKTQVTSDSMGAVVLKQAQTIEEKDIQLEPTDSDLSTLLSKQTGKYYLDDGPPEQTPYDLLSIPDAEVKIEPLNRFKNRPYVALGKTYQPLDAEKNYRAQGMGSWYGKRFHGKKTASGELYDMFKMTAAHPTLPIPSYARVTNLTNGTQIVVRINDRF